MTGTWCIQPCSYFNDKPAEVKERKSNLGNFKDGLNRSEYFKICYSIGIFYAKSSLDFTKEFPDYFAIILYLCWH